MVPPTATDTDLPSVGRRYDLDGRRLYVHRAGSGGPAVVLLPGAGGLGLDYLNLHTAVAKFTTAVLYDRGGTGWSDPLELPRSLTEVADELRALLRVVGIAPPYVLVGHSLGGFYARRYAQRWPDEVAGVLLLDPAHEDFDRHQPEVARQFSEEWKKRPPMEITPELVAAYRPFFEAMLAGWPAEIRGPLVERHLDMRYIPNGLKEASNVDALGAEIRSGGATPAVPTIVYTATGIDASQRMMSPEEVIEGNNQAKLACNEAFVAAVPGAEHRVLADASHVLIHIQREDAAVQGVRDLIARAAVARAS
jgi:pimeloyl-ACP methyl ester carboxylesterase